MLYVSWNNNKFRHTLMELIKRLLHAFGPDTAPMCEMTLVFFLFFKQPRFATPS